MSDNNKKFKIISESTLIKIQGILCLGMRLINQALSGAVFGGYLTLHLLTAMTASLGEATYESVMAIFRKVYQPHPIFEIVVIGGSAVVHLTSSLLRIYNRRKLMPEQSQNPENPKAFSAIEFARNLHRYAGYYIATTIGLHVLFTRGPFFKLGAAADFGLVANTLHVMPFVFYPYYTLLGIGGFYHLSYGLLQAAKVFGWKSPSWSTVRGKPFWIWIGTGSVLLFSALLAFGGVYFAVDQTKFAPYQLFADTLFQ